MVAGYLIGKGLACIVSPAPIYLVGVLQVVGAAILLWATLFVRGWDIQTMGGVSLTERVNQWIYRLLYCLGTTVIVVSLAVV
jgi:hypothetical protein